ncbi:hypothetical protein SAMN04489761_4662 [Tenacibaculum sp. MAR_2009_124]|uniref:hypothetical protein n=1 Tax=Tenacibaculum sp. MAR_2009_124 TaxID=1250059 RepID=UPI00089ACFD6|nr:hypothetical protein [Tenacibaculum sp. MAR_2009_124]SED21869.1 hypothetical protein SAMN04489761_4662 [Tenacibaculum sp. MAR_2009_124]
MTKEGIENSVVSLASMTAGAMASRIIADKLPIKNQKVKRGLLILGGIAAAASLDRKTTGKKVAQDAAISVAVTQTGYLLKEAFEGKLKDGGIADIGMGTPVFFDDSSYLTPYEEEVIEVPEFIS